MKRLVLFKETGHEFEVFRLVSTHSTISWDVTPYALVEMHEHLTGTYCLHHQCPRYPTPVQPRSKKQKAS
jgi:hypothetical protein